MFFKKEFFTEDEKQRIVKAIEAAELRTSGEVKLHVESKCKAGVLDRAAEVFAELDMHKTAARNGVLIYVAMEDHKFAIIGDAGINAAVPSDFWDKTKDGMRELFKAGKILEGVVFGISEAGVQLEKYFPHDGQNDTNELSNDISFGK
jgi:uncharacterized membrane protein